VSAPRGNGYRFVDGEVSGLRTAPHVIDFLLGNRRVSVENTAATGILRDGDRIRALLQEPFEDAYFHIVAFQKVAGGSVHYTGPAITLHVTIIGALLMAAGLYAGMLSLLVSSGSIIVLEWIFSAQKVAALKQFQLH
jgi:hypothetical protein